PSAELRRKLRRWVISPALRACAQPILRFRRPDLAEITREFGTAKRPALIEIADRIGLQLRLFRQGMFEMILALPRRAIAELIGARVIPPGAFVIGSAVKHLEMNFGMCEPDLAELHQILRL